MFRAVGRFEPTGPVNVQGLEHSVAALPWGVLRGALGPSDGSAGAASNVPSALGVLRHAPIYAGVPGEIDEAFAVLEQHVMRHGVLYPVALAAVPILFDTLRRTSPALAFAGRIADLLAHYAAAMHTLEAPLLQRLQQIFADHAGDIIRWLGKHDRALCAFAIHVPAVRDAFLAAIEGAERVAPEVLLALVELDQAPGEMPALALAMLDGPCAPFGSAARSGNAGPCDGPDASDVTRMCAAAFLARFGGHGPDVRARVDAALPPSAAATLRTFIHRLWSPTIERPAVAPRMYDAEIVFTGKQLVIVKAANKSVTLPWIGADVLKGDRVQVGLSTHGEPKLAVITDARGAVRVIDFDAVRASPA
jgi:hypothetical protein